MTAQEFVDKYVGKKVRVKQSYPYSGCMGMVGVVIRHAIAAGDRTSIVVRSDIDGGAYCFQLEYLEPVKVEPLPLPG